MQSEHEIRQEQWDEYYTLYNLTDPDILANPHPFYADLRKFGPVYQDTTVGWISTGFAECERILRDEACFSVNHVAISDDEVAAKFHKQMIFLEGGETEHRLLRRVLTPRLFAKTQGNWRNRADEIVCSLLDPLKEQGVTEIDVVETFAGALPVMLNMESLGLPPDELRMFIRWNNAYECLLGLPAGDTDPIFRDMREQMAYFTDVVARRRAHPDSDLISDMVLAGLNDEQIIANCTVLIAGGYATTTHLITMALYWLQQYPEQMRLLREDPSLVHAALKEVMRFDGSSQFLTRRTKTAVSLAGQLIPPNEVVFVLLPAANRDPRQFEHADEFIIQRTGYNKHLGFGAGRHTCLGGPLAEQIAEVAVLRFIERFPDYHIALPYEQLPWDTVHSNVRSVKHLPVRLHA